MLMARDAHDQFPDASLDAFAAVPQATFEAVAPPTFSYSPPLSQSQASASAFLAPAIQAAVVPFSSYDMFQPSALEQSQYIAPTQMHLTAPHQPSFYGTQPFPMMPMQPSYIPSYIADPMVPIPGESISPVNFSSGFMADSLQIPPPTEAAFAAAAPFEFSSLEELDNYFFPPPSSPSPPLDSLDLNVWVSFPDFVSA